MRHITICVQDHTLSYIVTLVRRLSFSGNYLIETIALYDDEADKVLYDRYKCEQKCEFLSTDEGLVVYGLSKMQDFLFDLVKKESQIVQITS